MPTFILVGFQRSLTHHVKKSLDLGKDQLNGWSCELFQGKKHNESWIGLDQVESICRLAEKHNGAHIFAVSSDRNRNLVEDRIRPYFRFRWLDAWLIGETGRGHYEPLVEELQKATQEDNFWLENIKPSDSASPLILPEIFNPKRDLANIWRLSQSYNNEGHLQAAAGLIGRFTREHRHRIDGFSNTPWLDEESWIWDDGGKRHGTAIFPEDWKYSLRLPDCFHFDVSPHRKKKTFFKDIHGKQHTLPKGYLNVTAHGEVRGT